MIDFITGSIDIYKSVIESIYSALGSDVDDSIWSVVDRITGSISGS